MRYSTYSTYSTHLLTELGGFLWICGAGTSEALEVAASADADAARCCQMLQDVAAVTSTNKNVRAKVRRVRKAEDCNLLVSLLTVSTNYVL